ncbi:MAG: hypothetical protein R3B06_07815 [Kofleriaceae bacterium]
MSSLRALVAAALVAALPAPAGAAPGDAVGALQLAPGQVRIAVVDERSLASGTVGAAWSLALDAVVGVVPGLSVGVSHSAAALGRMRGGLGLCRDSAAHDCPRVYDGGFLDVRWQVPGVARVTGLTRLGLEGLAPTKPVLRLGVIVRGGGGRLWWAVQPEVGVGLANRGDGNRDTLFVPGWVGLDRGRTSAWIETGLRSPIDGFVDKYEVRAGLGVAVRWRQWQVGVSAGFPQLLGPQNSGRIRQGALWLAYQR